LTEPLDWKIGNKASRKQSCQREIVGAGRSSTGRPPTFADLRGGGSDTNDSAGTR
jgi:hypothetical protein